jgi:S-layer homology domain
MHDPHASSTVLQFINRTKNLISIGSLLTSTLLVSTIVSVKSAVAETTKSAPTVATVAPSNRLAQATLSDVSGSWAEPFIRALAQKGIVVGYPDGSYRPDQLVTRAEFAAVLNKAFDLPATREGRSFRDVPDNYWGRAAIDKAYRAGFLAGYPNNTFAPNQNVLRVEALVALVNGSNLQPDGNIATNIETIYTDAGQIPSYARNAIIAGTQKCAAVSVSYPTGKTFNASGTATRADVAAFVHQILVASGRIERLPADSPAQQYIVNCAPTAPVANAPSLDLNTRLGLPTPPPVVSTTATRRGATNAPVNNVNVPIAFGANFGDIFATAGYQDRVPGTGYGIGIGLGNAKEYFGVETSYSTSANTGGNSIFNQGAINFKLHKSFGDNFAIAAGWENAIRQNLPADTQNTFYGVATGIIPVGESSNFTASVGTGNGRFRYFSDVNNNRDTINLFGSLGFRATENIGVVADWDGNAVNVGVPLTFKVGDNLGFQVIPSLLNVSGSNGGTTQFGLGGGVGFNF